MNSVELVGRITADPNVNWKDDLCISSCTLAADRPGEGTDFPMLKAFGKNAEIFEKYTHKGSLIAIRGHIHTDKYESKKTHTMVYTTDVVIEQVQLLDKKEDKKEEGYF